MGKGDGPGREGRTMKRSDERTERRGGGAVRVEEGCEKGGSEGHCGGALEVKLEYEIYRETERTVTIVTYKLIRSIIQRAQ